MMKPLRRFLCWVAIAGYPALIVTSIAYVCYYYRGSGMAEFYIQVDEVGLIYAGLYSQRWMIAFVVYWRCMRYTVQHFLIGEKRQDKYKIEYRMIDILSAIGFFYIILSYVWFKWLA